MLIIMTAESKGGAKMKDDPYTHDVVSVFEQIMDGCGMNYSKMAAMIKSNGKPMTRQAIFKMVKGGSLRVTTLFKILDALEIKVAFEKDGKVVSGRMPKF